MSSHDDEQPDESALPATSDEPASASPSPDGPGRHRRFVRRSAERKAHRSFWVELPILVVIAVGLALLIKTFLLQAFFIPSGSMENTLKVGDRVLVNKVVYDFRSPHRGEIVVFSGKKAGNSWGNVHTEGTVGPGNSVTRVLRHIQSFIGLGSPNDSDFIKRVIGVGGDTVDCPAVSPGSNDCAHVTVNGVPLDESAYTYATGSDGRATKAPMPTRAFMHPFTVPKGELFVMGDHRDNSNDSRFNGTIKVSSVVGKAFVTVWPLSRIGWHGVPKTFSQHLASSGALAPILGLLGAAPITLVRRRRRRRQRVRSFTRA